MVPVRIYTRTHMRLREMITGRVRKIEGRKGERKGSIEGEKVRVKERKGGLKKLKVIWLELLEPYRALVEGC